MSVFLQIHVYQLIKHTKHILPQNSLDFKFLKTDNTLQGTFLYLSSLNKRFEQLKNIITFLLLHFKATETT